MKKFLSVILAVLMLVSALSVSASAAQANEISYGETVTVKASTQPKYLKFVPEISGKYVLRSVAEHVDPVGELFVEDSEVPIAYSDDCGRDEYNFVLEYDFEAGKAYYFYYYVYEVLAEETEFDIVLECGHTYEDGECIICEKVCGHDEIGFLGFCGCGKEFLGKELTDGFSLEYSEVTDSMWFRFVADKSGYFLLGSDSADEESDPECILYDSNGEPVAENYDSDGLDFRLYAHLEEGETYFYEVYPYGDSLSGEISFSYLVHTADDGSVHPVDYVEAVYATCSDVGYSDGLFCPECDEYVSGHEELELDAYNHTDENLDFVCDDCGEVIFCTHICHSPIPFIQFIWRIVNFFCALFRINPVCACGDYHYIVGQ